MFGFGDILRVKPDAVRDAARISGGFADPSEWMEDAGLRPGRSAGALTARDLEEIDASGDQMKTAEAKRAAA